VWGSAALLLVALFVLVEYWSQPDRFRGLNSVSAEGEASPLAPLDPLSSVDDPVGDDSVSDDANVSAKFAELDTFSQPTDLQSTTSEFAVGDAILSPTHELIALDSAVNNVLATVRLGSPSVSSNALSSFSFPASGLAVSEIQRSSEVRSYGRSPHNPRTTEPESNLASQATLNPLQSALDRQARSREPMASSSASNPVETEPNSLSNLLSATTGSVRDESNSISTPLQLNRTYSPQPLPGQPSTQQTFPPPVYLPQMAPAPGTTGYTLPTTLMPSDGAARSTQTIQPTQNPLQFQPLPPPLPSTIQSETFGTVVQPSFQSEPIPFSIPRTPPNRTMGGGQINTFSNP
jgi:hypothetical protein